MACRLSDLIDGWIIALQQMHVGDKWEIYIPAEMGYGKYSQPGIPGGSTLIFEIELIGQLGNKSLCHYGGNRLS
jgi:FKBP-type peptidyl-prolyl cis-trans isomerase